jgi:hypothetical protein
MDKETRNAIERATQRARRLIAEDFEAQLMGTFDILRSGSIAARGGAHLSAQELRQREKIVAAIEHKRAVGTLPSDAVADYIRDAAFTTLNRFVALKMLEARKLVLECISKGEQSSGYREFCGLAPGVALLVDSAGYRLYIESLFDELSTEVKVLFDRRDPASVLWPKRATFESLLTVLNAPELSSIWTEDETIGWVYQYFNSQEERRAMRDASQAPRNSRDLAVRNQFFTPRYVVQFLTDNTVGRLWYEMCGGKTQLAQRCEYLVRRPDETWEPRPTKDPRDLRVLDPACGSGHFLLYCFDLFLVIYEEAWADVNAPQSEATGRTLKDEYPEIGDLRVSLPGLILRHNLHGVDIDPRCAQIAQLALWMRAQRAFHDFGTARAERPVIRRANVVIAEPMPGEKELLAEFLRGLKEDRLEGLLRRALDIPPERSVKATRAMADSLADLVATVWHGMTLAGEMGPLLKIERDLARAIEKGREEWEDRLPLFRVTEYGLGGMSKEELVRVIPGEQDDFWVKAERLVLQALADYAATAGAGSRRRLFAEEAAQGFALADLVTMRFDVGLTNPPFGEATPDAAAYLELEYPSTRLDLFAAFCQRLLEFATPNGLIGAITPRDGFFKKTLVGWRELILRNQMSVVADLGIGVLDSATVRVAAYTIQKAQIARSTRFMDLVDVLDRDVRLKMEVRAPERFYDVQIDAFRALPLARFLYWLPRRIWEIYETSEPLENNACTPRYGLTTLDDERFCRLFYEVNQAQIGRLRGWVFMSKGGDEYPYGGVSGCLVKWANSGAEMAELNRQSNGQIAQTRRASRYYFQPAIAFSNRSVAFSVRWHPADFAFSMRGPVIVPLAATQAYLLGFFNSRLIRALIEMQTASQTYTTGVLKELRWVEPDDKTRRTVELAATEAFEGVRRALATVETDPFFEGILVKGEDVLPRTVDAYLRWRANFADTLTDRLQTLQSTIDHAVASLYGVSLDDIERCERADLDDGRVAIFPPAFRFRVSHAEALASYLFGVAIGRWGCRAVEKSPSLAASVPKKLPAASDISQVIPIVVEDAGHPQDIIQRIRLALTRTLGDASDNDIGVLERTLGLPMREWLARKFFASHLVAYSDTGRRCPIYWQLATHSASYSVWLYVHAFNKDTMFRVQHDYVALKLAHEQRQLEGIRSEAGPNPSSAQRKAITAKETFVGELQAFLDEVKRVAPLWNPNLDDGVIVNFAPLWRLVPQHKPWQKELKATWDALCTGTYDWAHVAMHLWPERVVPKCAFDRSLAIAHDLETVFWEEGNDGKWTPRPVPIRPIEELVRERSSPAVKAALQSLLDTPAAIAGATRGQKRRAAARKGGGR